MTTIINRYGEKVSVPGHDVLDSDLSNFKVEFLSNADSEMDTPSHHEAIAWDSDRGTWRNIVLNDNLGIKRYDYTKSYGVGSVILKDNVLYSAANTPIPAGTLFSVDSDNWQTLGGGANIKTNAIYVSPLASLSEADGTFFKPYRRISDAFSGVNDFEDKFGLLGSKLEIILLPGLHHENVTDPDFVDFNSTFTHVTVNGYGSSSVWDSLYRPNNSVFADMTFSMKNITVTKGATWQDLLKVSSIEFDNVDFVGISGSMYITCSLGQSVLFNNCRTREEARHSFSVVAVANPITAVTSTCVITNNLFGAYAKFGGASECYNNVHLEGLIVGATITDTKVRFVNDIVRGKVYQDYSIETVGMAGILPVLEFTFEDCWIEFGGNFKSIWTGKFINTKINESLSTFDHSDLVVVDDRIRTINEKARYLSLDSEHFEKTSDLTFLVIDSDQILRKTKLEVEGGISPYNSTKTYKKLDVVIYDDSIYIANGAISSGQATLNVLSATDPDSDSWHPINNARVQHDFKAEDSDLNTGIMTMEPFTVTQGQTVFNLGAASLGDSMMTRNGIMVPVESIITDGSTVTYNPAMNQDSTIDLGDVVNILYSKGNTLLLNSPVQVLNDLTNVTVSTTPTHGEMIAYDSDTAKWASITPAQVVQNSRKMISGYIDGTTSITYGNITVFYDNVTHKQPRMKQSWRGASSTVFYGMEGYYHAGVIESYGRLQAAGLCPTYDTYFNVGIFDSLVYTREGIVEEVYFTITDITTAGVTQRLKYRIMTITGAGFLNNYVEIEELERQE